MAPSPSGTRVEVAGELDAESAGFSVSLSNFNGPFDLLLSLITKHELDITEVSLSRVTDEFITTCTASTPTRNSSRPASSS